MELLLLVFVLDFPDLDIQIPCSDFAFQAPDAIIVQGAPFPDDGDPRLFPGSVGVFQALVDGLVVPVAGFFHLHGVFSGQDVDLGVAAHARVHAAVMLLGKGFFVGPFSSGAAPGSLSQEDGQNDGLDDGRNAHGVFLLVRPSRACIAHCGE